MLHEAQALSGERHSLSTDIDPDLLLLGNPIELRSVFSNLAHNAVRHTADGCAIRIGWGLSRGRPEFWVKDDGIPPEHLPRLTERFYRVDQARSRASGGTGLGLAIVEHVLNRHDALLRIRSDVGQGSRFTCQFPTTRVLSRHQSQS
ncbi:MAG: ATP-binding protein [Anaerolineae bacterium]|jgi:two-component system phosphate regulon sensor histidine kinase PhoR